MNHNRAMPPKRHDEVAHNFTNRYMTPAQLVKPKPSDESTALARQKIDQIIGIKTQAAYGTNIQKLGNSSTQMVRLKTKGEDLGGMKQRMVRVDTVQLDPLLPAAHKHRKLPRGAGSPPPPLLRSPQRPLTQDQIENWKVPPCISNWRNPRGYTIPIHMRISADGRTLQHQTINESFADIIDSLYIAQRQSKIELEERAKVQKSVAYKEYLKKEEALRQAALEARDEVQRLQQGEGLSESEEQDFRERAEYRNQRRREVQREVRMSKVGVQKKKQIKRRQRDISEKVALGQAQPTSQDVQLDQRLFDNAGGIQAGNSDSEEENLYDKPLFADRSAVHSQLVDAAREKGGRTEPVKFAKQKEGIFGMGDLFSGATKRVKQ